MNCHRATKRRMGMRSLVAVIAATAALLAVPGIAAGSTASISGATLSFFAAAGETNNLSADIEGTDYILIDPGAPITPGPGCVAIVAIQVKCAGATVERLSFRLNDLNDSASVAASITGLGGQFDPGVSIVGDAGDDTITGGPNVTNALYGHDDFFDGPGEDTLVGGSLDDRLSGSGGNDIVLGGGGRDDLSGGDGDDLVNGGAGPDNIDEGLAPNGADLLIGGTGSNAISYGQRSGDVSLSDNGQADDGQTGEGDNVNNQFILVQTGNGDDTVVGSGGGVSYYTASGNDSIAAGGGGDQVNAGEGDDSVDGGDGPDQLNGGPGDDTVDGGPGDDALSDGSDETDSGKDQYQGGPGIDRLDYFTSEPLSIDLDGVADDGRPGEGDNAGTDLEDFNGGPGADILTGNDSPNQIDGGPGDDQIMGLGGPDELIGGPGDDDLDGGNGVDGIEGQGGSDSIRSRDNAADEVGCGSATDTLLADSLDVFSVTCDQSSTGAELKSGNVKLSKKGKAKVKVACPVAEGIDCQVKITANKGKKTVAKGSGKVKTGKTGKITLKLTKKGKRQKGKKIKGQASTQLTDATGAKVTTSRKLVLKR